MGERNATGSPLATVAETVGDGVAEAFGVLGNETRLAILLALWEAYDPHAGNVAVPFSELRERVGMRDSGGFNYHLGKLEDRFVRRTDDGYVLRPAGLTLVQTIIADTGWNVALPASEVDVSCHLCGAPTVIAYVDGWLYHRCTECQGGFGGTANLAKEMGRFGSYWSRF